MIISEPVKLDLTLRKWIYRLWAEDGTCLYVGQHKGIHPASRVRDHRKQPWWHEVARADYSEVLEGSLDDAEDAEIRKLRAKYNRENNPRPKSSPPACTKQSGGKQIIVNFSMDESFYKAFRMQARRDDKPMSEIVRQLIADYYLTTDSDEVPA